MRLNWKVLLALVLIVGTLVWAVDSLRTRSYIGTSLNFGVGQGPVTVINPSDAPLPVQLVGTGSRSFSVSSTTEGATGSSTRDGSGRAARQLYDFVLPPGTSVFTVARGAEVTFVADTDTRLQATVQPANASGAQTTLIATAVVILGALFYLSHTNGHRWISASRRRQAAEQAVRRSAASGALDHGQGSHIAAYGDNRGG